VLARLEPSPVVRLNRAVAISHVHDAETALTEVDALRDELDRYHLLHATRASLLRALGRGAEARDADVRALELAGNAAERRLLEVRLAQA
jgi:RNA polymerase sigma-70 factor (ECF subfamily)